MRRWRRRCTGIRTPHRFRRARDCRGMAPCDTRDMHRCSTQPRAVQPARSASSSNRTPYRTRESPFSWLPALGVRAPQERPIHVHAVDVHHDQPARTNGRSDSSVPMPSTVDAYADPSLKTSHDRPYNRQHPSRSVSLCRATRRSQNLFRADSFQSAATVGRRGRPAAVRSPPEFRQLPDW